MKCLGRNREDHCCYVNNAPCQFLEENSQPGFRWSCGLRRELGDWDLVIQDPRYLEGPGKVFGPKGINCRDFPDVSKGQMCEPCGIGDPDAIEENRYWKGIKNG